MNLFVLSLLFAFGFLIPTAFAEETNVEIVLLYPNGDRATINESVLFIESLDGVISKELVGDSSQSTFQTELDLDKDYKFEVYVHDMLVSTKIVPKELLKDTVTVNIPSSGGVKFLVYYNDGTPISDATVSLYSHKENLIRSGTTDSLGQTLRFWISTTPSENDFYVPVVSIGNDVTFTHSTLKLTSGSTDIKIVTPWPSEIDYLHVTAYKDEINRMNSWNGEFLATLTNSEFTKTISFNRGQVHFTSLPVGEFELTIFERDRPNLIWSNQTIMLSEKINDLNVLVIDPYPANTVINTSSQTDILTETIADNTITDLSFSKQSASGTQNIIDDDLANYIELVTDGDNSPVFTRSSEVNKDLSDLFFSAEIAVDHPEHVSELWFAFTSDNFESGWYLYSVPSHLLSKDWSTISFSYDDLELTGTQDIDSIDRIQIRVRDDGNPVSFRISSMNFDKPLESASQSCNCVAFRLDDIQDYFLSDVQMKLIETFQKNDIDLTIGIIANSIGRDIEITDFVSGISDDPGIEFANHGWEHEDFSQFDTVGQEMLLLRSNDKISTMFGVTPTVFIPPENAYNDGTISALHSLGFTHFSSELDFATPPFPLSGQTLYHFPETAFTGELNKERTRFVGLDGDTTFDQVEKSISEHGFAVVTLHPQEFSLFYHQNYQNDVDYAQIEQLELLFSKIKDHGIDTVFISGINNEPNQKLLVPQWVKNNAQWWIENRVSTEEFVNSLEFLVSNQIIHVSQTEQTDKISNIPKWIKQNISWWVDGYTSDSEFLSATEFLIQNGIIEI